MPETNPILAELSDTDVAKICDAATILSIAPGQEIISEGVECPYLYVLVSGELQVFAGSPVKHLADLFPGSWLQTPSGIKIIDPEFTHFGPPEFDVAIALAHLALAEQPQSSASTFLSAYGPGLSLQSLATSAAIEVMRRLIGLAQLPLSPKLDKPALLRKSHAALKNGNVLTLFEQSR